MWYDDSWKDSYDAWKLASPEDDHPEEQPEGPCKYWDDDGCYCVCGAGCTCEPFRMSTGDRIGRIYANMPKGDDSNCTIGPVLNEDIPF